MKGPVPVEGLVSPRSAAVSDRAARERARELLERFGRWYIAERDPRYLRRNALIALGNTATGDDPTAVNGMNILPMYSRGQEEFVREI